MSAAPRLVAAVMALAVQEDHEGMLMVADCQGLAYFLACDLARRDLQPYRQADGEVPPEARELIAARLQEVCLLLQSIGQVGQ